jgi:hypothetical protein
LTSISYNLLKNSSQKLLMQLHVSFISISRAALRITESSSHESFILLVITSTR